MDIHGYSHSFTTPVWAHPFDQSITLYLPLPASRGLEAWQVDDYDERILQFSSPWWISGSNPIQWSSSLAESVEISSDKPWVPNGINVSTCPPQKKPRESVVLDRFVGLSCVQIWRNDFRYMDWTTCRTNYIHEFGIMSKQPSEKWKSRNPLLNHGFQSFFLGEGICWSWLGQFVWLARLICSCSWESLVGTTRHGCQDLGKRSNRDAGGWNSRLSPSWGFSRFHISSTFQSCQILVNEILNDTSSTAQGGGGSFKNRKPIGEVGCCESGMAKRIHWWTERCLRSPLCLSLSLTIYLPIYLLCIYLSI